MSSLSATRAIDRICVDFEDACLNNNRPRIDTYLEKVEPQYRDDLIRELLPIELTYLPADELASFGQAYSKRFPSCADLISETIRRRTDGNDSLTGRMTRIGRYDIIRRIGSGGFGLVFEGFDSNLKRSVAIKVPRQKWEQSETRIQKALVEAQILANLNHPNILRVHDAGTCDEFGFFLVTALISGTSLSDFQRTRQVEQHQAIDIVSRIADALQHAHDRDVVHRDIKPQNIMLDRNNNPFLVDFGLAMETANPAAKSGTVGTPKYMSPEQARGENHRVDQTADIFSLGVVLSEIMTTSAALEETRSISSPSELPNRINHVVDDKLPIEVRRICLRATAERAADRYQNASEMARDLRNLQANLGQDESKEIASFVPRGLRPFERADASFFLKLLPGPYDVQGMPHSLRRLCDRLDNQATSIAAPVAVILGASGSGKSSFVKAGLLPLLPRRVTSLFLDASLPNLKRQLTATLSSVVGESIDGTIPQIFSTIRDGELLPSEGKLLVVIDHFEGWLSQQAQFETSELAAAMRHCDGRRVQFLVVCRDDFYTNISRLMRYLEIPLVDGESSYTMVPFDASHTETVLTAYGRAYGQIDDSDNAEASEQFVQAVASELVEDGAVVPVQIALIAETLKDDIWSPETLQRFGNVSGIIAGFLKARLESPDRHSILKQHPDVVCSVLDSLTNSAGARHQTTIATRDELRSRCPSRISNPEFDQLLTVLEREVCLVTQTLATSAGTSSFQLAHGFLVNPLRSWLRSHQLSTVTGRATRRLQERTEVWQQDPGDHSLPSTLEYLSFVLFTDRTQRSGKAQAMVNTARRQLLRKWTRFAAVITGLILIAGYAGYSINQRVNRTLMVGKAESDLRSAITSTTRSAQSEITAFIDSTEPDIRDQLLKQVASRIESEGEPPNATAKLRLKQLEAATGSIDIEYFVRTAINLSEEQYGLKINEVHTDEFSNIIAILKSAPATALRKTLRAEFEKVVRNGAKMRRAGLGKRRARLAIIGMYSGQPELARLICDRNSPLDVTSSVHDDMRTQFLFQSRWLRGDPHVIVGLLKNATNNDFKTCLVNLFSIFGTRGVGSELQPEVEQALQQIYSKSQSAGLISAAQHVLQKWDAKPDPLTLINCDECTVTPVGHVMIQCRSLNKDPITIIGDEDLFLWVSKTETTRIQYREFLMATAAETQAELIETLANNPNHPIGNISLIDAMSFCNWMSEQESLDKVYDFEVSCTDPSKVLITNSENGYRLPMIEEWHGFSGHVSLPVQIMQIYGWTAENANSNANSVNHHPVMQRIPNLNGLSDVFGSVREWTVLPNPKWNTGRVKHASLHGGSTDEIRRKMGEPLQFIHNKSPVDDRPTIDETIGFRIVRNGASYELVGGSDTPIRTQTTEKVVGQK